MIFSARRAARKSLAVLAALAFTATTSATAHAEEPAAPEARVSEQSPAAPALAELAPEPAEPAPAVPAVPAPAEPEPADPVPAAPVSAPASPEQPEAVPAQPTVAAQPEAPPAPAAASAPVLSISATPPAAPFLVGQQIPVQVVITNTGDADAVGVRANDYTQSGSGFLVNSDQWGDLAWSSPQGATVPAGDQLVVNLKGQVQAWYNSVPNVVFTVSATNAPAAVTAITIPLVDPSTSTDTAAGLVYGDRNGNGSPDAGEGLQGVQVSISLGALSRKTTTDATGRFQFAALPLGSYNLSFWDVPDGWVLPGVVSTIVDGQGSGAHLQLRGVRPLSDQLSATMKFFKPVYNVGDRAEFVVRLRNRGTTDLTGVKAECDRSGGEGPELRAVDLGDLASGVTVPAGDDYIAVLTGDVSAEAGEYGAVVLDCDFGIDQDDLTGRPMASVVARVPAPPADLSIVLYNDRNENWNVDAGEPIPGLSISLVDAVTKEVAAVLATDARGQVVFRGLPAGPYRIKVLGPWKPVYGDGALVYAGACANCATEMAYPLLPTSGTPSPDPQPTTPQPTPPAVPVETTTVVDPAPQARPSTDLADTGANVLWLTALGALALLVGFGATFATRRRSA
ncbi:LPXTG-motif cell wall-anchored protein [Actinokineospora baliensis]|uniref:SdrD B-like domain-containing protein n=1 Tax=Actinokineospora baliensis TaxID=547056 RepID=UPI00195C427C|nr:SdrD B-like domain-containing protein [Actinokineospora baliensis]MBM7771265.1 LPXTG-motif cell wall-anchored protein [Actinokineospora baliensis]